MGVNAATMDPGDRLLNGEHGHAPAGGDQPVEGSNGAVRVGYVLGHHAQGDEIELLVGRKVLEQALMTLMAGSI